MSDYLTTEVLILGSGIAGGTTALQLADAGVPVILVTRARDPMNSNTAWAQGGIIHTSSEDAPELLYKDILHAGAGHSYPPAAKILAEEGPDRVREILLDKVNVPFDRNQMGELEAIKEAAHSAPRIVHVADSTGKSIAIALLNKLKKHPNVTLLTGHTAIDLITPSHNAFDRLRVYEPRSCLGAYVLDQDAGCVKRILAKETVLATGGLGQVYARTTNPKGACGDGIAMAYRAGARVINMEFIQFHPTTFRKNGAPNFLISEAVRGAGGRLVHGDGRPFMQKYDSEWKDLAPRDVVARSIHQEMIEHDLPNVYLDFYSYIDKNEILRRFPSIHAQCLRHGVDATAELVPVVPGAHYACGGIWVDLWGRTTIANLYAVGEVACTGLHGANRLASTSLLEGLVWGDRAARQILKDLPSIQAPEPCVTPAWQDTGMEDADPVLIAQDMYTIQQTMWHYVGLARTTARLARALRELRHLETEIEDFYRRANLTDQLIALRNAVRTALIVSRAAWSNKKSSGCHYRSG
ncbi:MAG: L-aspartate oxidase [Chloroflexota bacterium]